MVRTLPDTSPARKEAAALKRATATFLAGFAPWERFVTLTFSRDVCDAAAHLAFRRWARHVACGLYRSHVNIAWAYGPQARGTLHFHALVAPAELAAAVTPAELAAAWHEGPDVTAAAVTAAAGAADYLTRHPEWNLNVACDRRPCCRRAHGCVIAPGPWSAT